MKTEWPNRSKHSLYKEAPLIKPHIGPDLKEAAEVLRSGGIVVYPTDTVFGIGCSINCPSAISAVLRAKNRTRDRGLPVLLSNAAEAHGLCVPNANADTLASQFWPGGLTIICEAFSHLRPPIAVNQSIALRVPDHTGLRDLISSSGSPIVGTSANMTGLPPATSFQEALRFVEMQVETEGVDIGYLLTGECQFQMPSTVINLTTSPPSLERHGPISADVLKSLLPDLLQR